MRQYSRALWILLPLLLGLSSSATHAAEKVKAWQGTITIPTYPWGPDDYNPKFFALENSIIYPYTMQDNLSTRKVNRVYKALYLENEYLRVTCLPELSGRIFSVLDKTTDEEMFHLNRVVKPGLIGMRGAWISGGIEWNTGPHGHTVTCVTPVDVVMLENEDGSASLLIGNTEQIFRTRWTVRVTLHPGKAYLDENISIANPTDGVHPYYFWNCTAFLCLPGTRFIYPMTLGTDHSGTSFFSWPVHEGKDLTWLKNYEEPTSVFAYHCIFDFFGAYDVNLNRGIVQYADHNVLIGKKAWTWGQSGSGLVSQRNLHEGNEQYIEVQSGPLLTQADYGLLSPHAGVAWREWWYPVHGLGDGFEYATRDVAIQTARAEAQGVKKLELRLIATGEFPSARVILSQDKKNLLSRDVDLSPKVPVTLVLSPAPEGPVEVTVQKDKEILASFTTPLPIPKVTPPQRDWLETLPENQLGVEQKYLKGLLFDKQTERVAARDWYQRALAADPQYAPALRALAVLDLEAGLYDDAAKRLEKAEERNPDDGLAWFFLGAVRLKQEQPELAKECGYKAVKTLDAAALGYDLVGRAWMKLGRYAEAIDAFDQAVERNPQDRSALDHLFVACTALKNMDKLSADRVNRLKEDLTDLIPLAITAVNDPQEMKQFVIGSRSVVGEYDFEIMEVAHLFVEMNLLSEAARLLQTCCLEVVPNEKQSPLVLYFLAYIENRLGRQDESRAHLRKASTRSVDYVFPSRPEEIAALNFAIQQQPEDAAAHLYLGNLLGGLGRLEEAMPLWKKASELNRSLSTAFRNLGHYAWKKENRLDQAEELYQKAIAARPEDQTLIRDLAQIRLAAHKRPDAILLLENMPNKEARRGDLIEILSQAYVDEKRYTDVLNLLEKSFFSNWENRTLSHQLFARAHLERGKDYFEKKDWNQALADFTAALTYPDNLGSGRPSHPDEAEALYWKGKALAELNRMDEARSAWKLGAESSGGPRSQREFRDKCKKALEG